MVVFSAATPLVLRSSPVSTDAFIQVIFWPSSSQTRMRSGWSAAASISFSHDARVAPSNISAASACMRRSSTGAPEE